MFRRLLVLVFSVFLAIAPFAGSSHELYSSTESYEPVELTERLFAVHATSYLPVNGYLKASLGYKEEFLGDLPVDLYPDFRSTVHFSLGELVRGIENVISWEACPYAVVTPLSDLMPQVLNLNCYDTFVLGDFHLTSASILIIPSVGTEQFDHTPNWQIRYYDPTETTLREAVDGVIASNGGWAVRMLEDDEGDEFNIALSNNCNINTPAFFAPLKELYPHVSVGLRYEPFDGDAYLFGELENMIYSLAWQYLPIQETGEHDEESMEWGIVPLGDLIEWRNAIVERLVYLRDFVAYVPFPEISKSTFDEKQSNLLSWLNIVDADIRLRLLYDRTLMQAPADIWRGVLQYKHSIDCLNAFLDASCCLLPVPQTRFATPSCR